MCSGWLNDSVVESIACSGALPESSSSAFWGESGRNKFIIKSEILLFAHKNNKAENVVIIMTGV